MWIDEVLEGTVHKVRLVEGDQAYIENGVLCVGTAVKDILQLVTLVGLLLLASGSTPALQLALGSYRGWSLVCDRIGTDRAYRILRQGSSLFFLIKYSVAHILMSLGAVLAFRERGVTAHPLRKLLRTVGIDPDQAGDLRQLTSLITSLFPPDVLSADSLNRFIK